MPDYRWIRRCASDEDNVTLISSAWCRNRTGICLSFAVPMEVMDVDEISEFGEMFVDAVKASYGTMLSQLFGAKSAKPLVCATDGGELIMLWSFQGEDDDKTLEALDEAMVSQIG